MTRATQDYLEELISKNDTILFMKGSPETPKCGYSKRVVQALNHLDVTYTHIDVLEEAALRSGVKEVSKVRTLPQLFVKGTFIGGSDVVVKLFENNELQNVFMDHGIVLDTSISPLTLTTVTMDERRQCGKL